MTPEGATNSPPVTVVSTHRGHSRREVTRLTVGVRRNTGGHKGVSRREGALTCPARLLIVTGKNLTSWSRPRLHA